MSYLIAVALAWAWAWTTVERILKNASCDLCGNRVSCNPLLSINHALSLLLLVTTNTRNQHLSFVCWGARQSPSQLVRSACDTEDAAHKGRHSLRGPREREAGPNFLCKKKWQRCAGSKKISLTDLALFARQVRPQCLQLTASVGVCRKWSTRLLVSLHCASDLPCI
jgi:hypothetical protein